LQKRGEGEMSHELVKITIDEDFEPVREGDQVWCLGWVGGGSPVCLCNSQVYGLGEGNAIFETKIVMRGGITCEDCMRKIKALKRVKL